MSSLFRCMRSDLLKLKRTFVLNIHIILPIIAALIFLAYYSISSYSIYGEITGFIEAIAGALPAVIGIITGMVIEQEEMVGNFQMVLGSTKCKLVTYLSKLILLLLLELFSLILTIGIFGVGFKQFDFIFYVSLIFILFLSSIVLYILHIIISFQFGKGLSIGAGMAGSLVSLLMITGLGDGIWTYTPWAYGVRFCNMFIVKFMNPNINKGVFMEVNKGIITMTIEIIIGIIISIIWFKSYEGRKEN